MAASATIVRGKSKKGKGSPSSASKANNGKKNIITALVVIVGLVVLVELSWLLQNQLAAPANFPVQTVLKFSGADQPCGAFSAWGLTQINGQWIAISDQSHKRILIFDMKGQFVKEIGQKQAGQPPFNELSGMTSDPEGHLYVMDAWNGMVRGFDLNGRPTVKAQLQNSYGPRGAVWDKGNFIVTDTGTHRIVKISPEGTQLAVWGHSGSEKGAFINPVSAAVDADDNIYVADSDNHRVQCLSPNGKFVRSYNVGSTPLSVALDSQGRIYVSCPEGNFVKVFAKNGKLLGKLTDAAVPKGEAMQGLRSIAVAPDGDIIASRDSEILILHSAQAGPAK